MLTFLVTFLAAYVALIAYRFTEFMFHRWRRKRGQPAAVEAPSLFVDSDPQFEGVTTDTPEDATKDDEAQKQKSRPFDRFIW